MHKNIDPKDFEGKTIRKLVAEAVNVIEFYFTDGTSISIETEGFGGGLVGMVACDTCATTPPKTTPKNGVKGVTVYFVDVNREHK